MEEKPLDLVSGTGVQGSQERQDRARPMYSMTATAMLAQQSAVCPANGTHLVNTHVTSCDPGYNASLSSHVGHSRL